MMANGAWPVANSLRRVRRASMSLLRTPRRQRQFPSRSRSSASRAEIIFDQGLGDLFVIRVAGNIVASSQIGSVEFAAERFGTPLVVVLGHSRCGAVLATLEELMRPREKQSRNLRSIVDRIRPSVDALLATELRHDPEALVRHAIRNNVRVSANHLRHGSEVLEPLIQREGLLVVGAEYSLESGVVDFFDGVPEAGEISSATETPEGPKNRRRSLGGWHDGAGHRVGTDDTFAFHPVRALFPYLVAAGNQRRQVPARRLAV